MIALQQPLQPVPESHINRGGTTVHVVSSTGDDLFLDVSPPTASVVMQEAAQRLGVAQADLSIVQDGMIKDGNDIIDAARPVEMKYLLAGGGRAHCGIVKGMPACCRLDLLCFKCGLTNHFPHLTNDFLFEHQCFCCVEACGCVKISETQVCCVRCYPHPGLVTAFPACCRIDILCNKLGCTNTHWNATNDDCCMDKLCCLVTSLGMRNWTKIQLCCLECGC